MKKEEKKGHTKDREESTKKEKSEWVPSQCSVYMRKKQGWEGAIG